MYKTIESGVPVVNWIGCSPPNGVKIEILLKCSLLQVSSMKNVCIWTTCFEGASVRLRCRGKDLLLSFCSCHITGQSHNLLYIKWLCRWNFKFHIISLLIVIELKFRKWKGSKSSSLYCHYDWPSVIRGLGLGDFFALLILEFILTPTHL